MTQHISFEDNSAAAAAIIRDARGVIVSHRQSSNLQFCLFLKSKKKENSNMNSFLSMLTAECTAGIDN